MPDSSGTHLWLVLMKAHRALGRHAQATTRSQELGFSDFVILEALLHRGPMLVGELGRRVALTSGSMTSAVDRLETRGLVERSATAADRRARVIKLSPSGRALISKAFARHKANMDAAANDLTAAERASLIVLLKKLGKSAEAKLSGPAASARPGDELPTRKKVSR
jgi:MarR family 2-MHQ and catechol resistance regulon transcriptional repressor